MRSRADWQAEKAVVPALWLLRLEADLTRQRGTVAGARAVLGVSDSPLTLEVGEGDLLELTVLKDGGRREGRGGLLNKCLGHVD